MSWKIFIVQLLKRQLDITPYCKVLSPDIFARFLCMNFSSHKFSDSADMLTIFVSKRCIFAMSKVNEQLSKLASLFPLPICQSLNILYALFVESRVNFCMQSSNNLLYSSALFAGRKTILAACIFHIYPETVLLWQTVVKGLCSCLLLHTSPRKSYFWILNNTYSNYILIQDKLLLLCSELNICLPLN